MSVGPEVPRQSPQPLRAEFTMIPYLFYCEVLSGPCVSLWITMKSYPVYYDGPGGCCPKSMCLARQRFLKGKRVTCVALAASYPLQQCGVVSFTRQFQDVTHRFSTLNPGYQSLIRGLRHGIFGAWVDGARLSEAFWLYREGVRRFATFWRDAYGTHLTQSVFEVVVQKSIQTQIRQLILYISRSTEQFDGFVRELTFAKRLCEHSLWDKNATPSKQ